MYSVLCSVCNLGLAPVGEDLREYARESVTYSGVITDVEYRALVFFLRTELDLEESTLASILLTFLDEAAGTP